MKPCVYCRYGAIHKICDARGGTGCLSRSRIMSQEGGGVSQGGSRTEWHIGEHVSMSINNKTVLANMCPFDDESMFSIKILLQTSPWNTALNLFTALFIQRTSENLSGKLFRPRFNKAFT